MSIVKQSLLFLLFYSPYLNILFSIIGACSGIKVIGIQVY